MADCLARLGHIEEGAALLLKNDVSTIKKLSRAQQAEIHRAATFRAAYGSYSEALKLYERLAALSPRANDLKLKVAWFSYRSGRYEKAAKQLEAWSKRAPRSKDFALYWMARAHARAGQTEKAEELYRLLLSSYGRSYYGLLARSRLGENRKIPRPASPKSCPEETSTAAPVTDSNSEVLPRLATLITRYVDLYPSLRRVQSLWRMGMISDAQRELRLIAIDAAWIKARGRSARYVQRPDVERLWRDGPLPQRRWGKRERQIFKEGAPLRYDLGLLMTKSGISYFGWQLSPPDEDPLRHQYPRAYHDVVIASAKRFKLDPYIIWAIMRTESQYRLDVISRVGATGLMQIMPQTGLRIAVLMKLNNFHRSQLFDPETNVLLAGWYLRALSDKFKNQLALVAAAYNGGPHHVARWLDQRGKNSNMDEFIEEIPFSESKRYAKKILRLVAQYLRIYCAKDDWVTSNALAIGYGAHPDF